MAHVLVCTNYNAETSTCMAEAWMVQPTLLPPLSIAEGALIASAIIINWAWAVSWRTVEKVVRQ